MAKASNRKAPKRLRGPKVSRAISTSSESDTDSSSDSSAITSTHSNANAASDIGDDSDDVKIPIPNNVNFTDLPESVAEYIRQLQQKNNDASDKRRVKAREKLGDVTNGQDKERSRKRKRKSKKVKKRAEIEKKELECSAHCLAATGILWFRGSGILEARIDSDYTPAERFETKKSRVQGQVRDLLDVLPEELKEVAIRKGRIPSAYLDTILPAMGVQRSNMATRVRNVLGSIVFGISDINMKLPETRSTDEFKDLAGLLPPNESDEHSAFDVPLLHSNLSTKYDKNTIFLNPMLMQLYSGIIRGPSSTVSMKAGLPVQVCAETMVQVWELDHVTPGAIACAAILARWCVSADTKLQTRGDRTYHNWAKDFHIYLEYLTDGLHKKKRSVIKIFRKWNEELFPGVDQAERENVKGEVGPTGRSVREEAALSAMHEESEAESEERE